MLEYGIFTAEGASKLTVRPRPRRGSRPCSRAEAEAQGYARLHGQGDMPGSTMASPNDSCEPCWEYDEEDDAA